MGLFNRPTATVAATAGSSSDQPSDIFSHSQSFNAILAEQAQRRKEKQEKQRGKSDGKRKSEEGSEESPRRQKRATPKKEKTEESPKRRRISGQDVGKLLEASGIFGRTVGDDSEDEQIVMEPPSQKASPQRKRREGSRLTRSSSKSVGIQHDDNEVIEVGESSGDEAQGMDVHGSMPAEQDDESDEELAALASQARQRRLRQTQSATPDITAKAPTSQAATAGSPQNFVESSPLPDPAVKILIQSRIDNTNPLLVYRKLSQDLRDVRHAWCQRQNFDEDFTAQVFLIYRTRRVYDVTTVRSLGLETDPDGNITMRGAEGKDGVDQVALEAVTEGIFAKILSEKAKDEAKRLGQWDPDSKAGAEEETSAPEAAAEELIGIVLRAKGKPDFKLKVKPVSQLSSTSD